MRERGTVTLVAATGTLVLCLTALAGADLGALLAARARAQAAADAAALAAVVNQIAILGQGDDPEDAAREQAEANDALLARCACEAGSLQAEVEVTVPATASFVPAWRGRIVRASARATVDPAVLSYRE